MMFTLGFLIGMTEVITGFLLGLLFCSKVHVFHRWSRWSSEKKIRTISWPTKETLEIELLKRTCETCGLIQQRSAELR